MHNYKAVIEYDGSNFHGFQIQPGGLRTVQHEILKVLNQIFNNEVNISYADVYKRQILNHQFLKITLKVQLELSQHHHQVYFLILLSS